MIPTPLSGDPETVAAWALRYQQTAEKLKRAANDLRDLTDDETFVSLAVDEISLKALDARSSTEKVSLRYDGAGNAFAAYASELRAAQVRAENAIRAFHNADGSAGTAGRRRDDLENQVAADNGQTPGLVDELLSAVRAFNNWAQESASALGEYHAAVEDKRQAVNRAIAALDDAADDSGLNDNFFEAIGGHFQQIYELAQKHLAPILAALHEVLSGLADILGKITLVLSVLAVFLPVLAPLAAAMTAVSLVVSGLVLLCSLALFALGKASLGQLLGDAISFAAGAIMSKAGPVFKRALGAADDAALALAQPAMAGKTLGSQLSYVLKNGLNDVQAVTAVAEGVVGVTENVVTDLAVGAATDVGGGNTIDLAPSAAGPDWNAPPTIEVEPLPANESYSAAELVEPPVVQTVTRSLSAGMPVSAGASA